MCGRRVCICAFVCVCVRACLQVGGMSCLFAGVDVGSGHYGGDDEDCADTIIMHMCTQLDEHSTLQCSSMSVGSLACINSAFGGACLCAGLGGGCQ